MRSLALLTGLPALAFAVVTGVLIAGGLNFGYEFHPGFLLAAAVTGAVTVALGFFALTITRLPVLARLAAPLAVIGVCFGVVVALFELGEPTPAEAVRADAPLYDRIPAHPDAKRGAIVPIVAPASTDMFEEGFLNQPTCCWTSRTDELRTQRLVSEVADFYGDALEAGGWHVRRLGAGGPNQRVDLIGDRDGRALQLAVRPRTGKPPVVDILIYRT